MTRPSCSAKSGPSESASREDQGPASDNRRRGSGHDVDQLDTVCNEELECLVRVFKPRHPRLRVLVVLEVDLLLPQRRQQRIQHDPVVPVLLNVVDDVRAIQQDVRSFRDRLVCENPVCSVALE